MKKAILILAFLLVTVFAHAEGGIIGTFDKLNPNTGWAWTLKGKESVSLTTITAIQANDYYKTKYKIVGYLDPQVNLGYASNDNFVVGGSMSVLKLKDFLSIPILDLIELRPFVGYGFGSLNLKSINSTHNDWFFGTTILKVNF